MANGVPLQQGEKETNVEPRETARQIAEQIADQVIEFSAGCDHCMTDSCQHVIDRRNNVAAIITRALSESRCAVWEEAAKQVEGMAASIQRVCSEPQSSAELQLQQLGMIRIESLTDAAFALRANMAEERR